MKKNIKFLPDIIILIGVWLILQPEIFSYHERVVGLCFRGGQCNYDYYYHTDWDKIGIIIVLIGIDILIRKFLSKKDDK